DGQNLNFAVAAKHVKALLELAAASPKPLASLPELKYNIDHLAAGDAKRTLEYWNQRIKIEGNLTSSLERPKSWRSQRDALSFSEAATKAARLYVADVSKLEITDVDDQLVDIVLEHVNLIRMLADRWTLYGEAIRSRNLEKAEKIIAEVDEV